jgi:hypothetical protein
MVIAETTTVFLKQGCSAIFIHGIAGLVQPPPFPLRDPTYQTEQGPSWLLLFLINVWRLCTTSATHWCRVAETEWQGHLTGQPISLAVLQSLELMLPCD